METSREDVGIAIRSAFLSKGTKQRFSLFVLIIISILLIFFDSIDTKILNNSRSFIKDIIYRGTIAVSLPSKSFSQFSKNVSDHLNLYKDYNQLKEENAKLKNNISEIDFLELENSQLRQLIDEQIQSPSNLVSARVIIDKQSPYLNSFIINIGTNKKIKKGMAALDGKNFVGRIVDVNYFSSRVLLISDLNSKIPIIIEPTAEHGILSGHGSENPTIDYLPENYKLKDNDKIYTSGKEGIFSPGLPIGEIKIDEDNVVRAKLFSDLGQITFLNIDLGNLNKK